MINYTDLTYSCHSQTLIVLLHDIVACALILLAKVMPASRNVPANTSCGPACFVNLQNHVVYMTLYQILTSISNHIKCYEFYV